MSVPSAPLIVVRPAATNQTLEFYWAPPASDGGSAIVSYTLACSAISFSQSLASTDRYYKATGLTNNTSYTFTLTATNSTGEGPAATFRTVKPGNRPQNPVGVGLALRPDDSAVDVTWTNPTDVGDATLIRNLVTAVPLVNGAEDPAHAIKRATYGDQTARVVAGLSTTVDYNVYVQSINDPGYSRLSSFAAISRGAFSLADISGAFGFWADMADPRFIGYDGSTITYIREKSSNALKMDAPAAVDAGYGVPSVFPTNTNSTIGGYQTITFGPAGSIATVQQYYRAGSNASGIFYVARTNLQSNALNNEWRYPTLLYDGYYQNYVGDYNPADSNTLLYFQDTGLSPSPAVAHLYTNGTTTYDQYSNVYVPAQDSTFILSVQGIKNGGDYTTTLFQGLNQNINIPNRGLHANVAEVIVTNSTITDPQARKIEGYLAWKYGLTGQLPTGHPYKTTRPKNAQTVDPTILPGGLPLIWLDGQDPLSQVSDDGVSTLRWLDRSGRATASACNIGGLVQKTTAGPYFSNGIMRFAHDDSVVLTNILMVAPQDGGGTGYLTTRPGGAGESPAWLVNYTTPSTFELFYGGVVGNTITNTTSTAMMYWKADPGTFTRIGYNGSIISDSPFIVDVPYIGIPYGTIGNGFVGNICEYITYPYALSTNEQDFIEGYLAWKWASQGNLPSNHRYKLAAPASYPTFSPSNVSSLALWLDATDPLANGSTPSNGATVSQWYDKSGMGNHAYAATGTPPYYLNTERTKGIFIPDQNGSGSNHALLVPTASDVFNFSTLTVFVSFTPRETTGYNGLLEVEPSNHSNDYGVVFQYVTRDVLWDLGGDGGSSYTNGSLANGGTYIAYHRIAPTQRSTRITGSNIGSNQFSRVYADSYSAPVTDISQAWIGRVNVNNYTYNGVLNEVLVYKGTLNSGDEREIKDYLYKKWCTPAALTSPTQIPNLALWLDAADPLGTGTKPSNGTTLSNWVDKSGLGNDAVTPSTAGFAPPTYYTNAYESYVNFSLNSNTVNGLTASNVDVSSKPYTIFVVERMKGSGIIDATITGNIVLGDLTGGAGNARVNFFKGGPAYINDTITGGTTYYNYSGGSNSGLAAGAAYFENGITRVWTAQKNAELYSYAVDNIQNMHILLNGQIVGSNFNSNFPVLTGTGFCIGGLQELPTFSYNGDIKEVLIYDEYMSDADRTQVESYLTTKWLREDRITSPTQVAGLGAWFDAADPLGTGTRPASGTLLSNWVDKSSNSRDFVVTNGSNPVYKNFGPISYLQFVDTSNNYMEMLNPSFLTNTYYTIFMVSEGTPAFYGSIMGDSHPYEGGYGNFQIYYNGAFNAAFWRTGGSNNPNTNVSWYEQRFNLRELYCFTTNEYFGGGGTSNSGGVGVFRYTSPPDAVPEAGRSTYGMQRSYPDSNGGKFVIDNLSTLCLYNAQLDQTSNINAGKIYEILFYTGNMTGEDRLRVKNYLSRKWDISIKNPVQDPWI